jgi:ferredoxin
VKVSSDRDKCIGADMCVMTPDAVFDQDEDGIVLVRASTGRWRLSRGPTNSKRRRVPAASAPTLRVLSRELQICAGPPVSTRAPSQDYRVN